MKSLTNNQYIVLAVLFGLYILYRCHTNKRKNVEGIENMNCCGGIKAGVHYLETDKKPPRFVKRCFKSNRGSDGRVEYEWDPFPCSQAGSSKCCDGDGECIPTSRGGFCKRDGGNVVFNYKKGDSSVYIPSNKDKELDITNVLEMEDYYDDIGYSRKGLSLRAQEFKSKQRDKEKAIERRIINRNIKKNLMLGEARDKKIEELKKQQVISTVIMVHVLFLLAFAFVIKNQIVGSIDSFFGVISSKVLEFQGKTVSSNPSPAA